MPLYVRPLIVSAGVAAIAVFALGASNTRSLAPETPADSIAVAKVVSDFQTALSTGDSVKALSLLATDAVILESGGVEPRSEYRSHHLPEDIKFARTVAPKRGPLQVRIQGSAAWTVATSTAQGTFKGRTINSVGAESMVLTKRGAGWQIRSIHWSSRERRAE